MATELVVVVKTPGPMIDEISAESDSVMLTPKPWRSQLRRCARIPGFDRAVPLVDRSIARSVVRQLRPDFIYANTVLSSEYVAAAQIEHIPSVLHVHESQPLSAWAMARSRLHLESVSTLAPSQFVANELNEMGVTSATVIRGPLTLSPTADEQKINDLPWRQDSFRVIACGTVAPWKGTREWLDCAERLTTIGNSTVEWTWIGTGAQIESVRRETVRREMDARVHWLGEKEDVKPYLASADLFVLPSHREPLGLVLLEAASAGIPSIAFDAGGVREILVDDRALAEPGDVVDMVRKIRLALTDSHLRAELLAASRPAILESSVVEWQSNLTDFLRSRLSMVKGN